MAVTKDTTNPGSEQPTTFDFVMQRFNAARKYTKRYYWQTWDDCWKTYNNERVLANYEGNSDGFVPETFTIIQAVKAHIIGPDMKLKFMPTSQNQKGDVSTLNALFDFAWYQDKTDGKLDSTILDYEVTGNGYLFQYVGEDKFPKNRYVSTNDAFFDPDACNYDDLRYCGYRYLTKLSDLKDETITNSDYNSRDPSSTIKVGRYKDLDKIEPGFKQNDDKTAKALREEMMGGSTTGSDDDVECIVYYDKKKMVTIANRLVVIEEADTPFRRKKKTIQSVDDQGNAMPVELPEIKPFLPVAPFRNYKDGALFVAKGDVEYIQELQERLNDTQNQKTDNLSFILNRMWTLDPAYASKIEEIQSVPGAVFTIPPGALEQVPTAPIGADADNEIYRIKDEMRRATSADELIQGAQQQKGSITATEANAVLAQAGTRFNLKLNELENEGFRILANNMFKLMQITIDHELAVRVLGPNGIEWKTYNPGEFLGEYDIKVELKSTYLKKREEEKQNAMQFFLLASKLPFVNQELLFKTTATTLFDVDQQEVEALTQPFQPFIPKPQVKISLKGDIDPISADQIASPSLPPTPHPMPGMPGQPPLLPGGPGNLPTEYTMPPVQQNPGGTPAGPMLPPNAAPPIGQTADASQNNNVPAGNDIANIPGFPQA